MSAHSHRLECGTRVLIHPCDVCESDRAPFGYFLPGQRSRWFCHEHRSHGEALLEAPNGN